MTGVVGGRAGRPWGELRGTSAEINDLAEMARSWLDGSGRSVTGLLDALVAEDFPDGRLPTRTRVYSMLAGAGLELGLVEAVARYCFTGTDEMLARLGPARELWNKALTDPTSPTAGSEDATLLAQSQQRVAVLEKLAATQEALRVAEGNGHQAQQVALVLLALASQQRARIADLERDLAGFRSLGTFDDSMSGLRIQLERAWTQQRTLAEQVRRAESERDQHRELAARAAERLRRIEEELLGLASVGYDPVMLPTTEPSLVEAFADDLDQVDLALSRIREVLDRGREGSRAAAREAGLEMPDDPRDAANTTAIAGEVIDGPELSRTTPDKALTGPTGSRPKSEATNSRPPATPPTTTAMSRRRRRILIAGSAMILFVTAGFGMYEVRGDSTASQHCGGAGSGISRIGGECVGVTDGSFAFNPELAPVEEAITAENNAAMRSGRPVVTIAVLEPMTSDATSPLSVTNIRNDLEGALTAEHRVNDTDVLGTQQPTIRLVLANEGSHEVQWQPVVRQLEEMVNDPAPLVAVTGLGVSTVQTEDGAKDLGAHDIPTVAAIDSADQLNAGAIHGFIRVVADNAQHVASLENYLQNLPGIDSAMMVYDSSPDLFASSLRNDVRDAAGFSRLRWAAAQTFADISNPLTTDPEQFASIVFNVCAARPQLVFFAGRGGDLLSFIVALRNRICGATPITLVTADYSPGGLEGQAQLLKSAGITLVYAPVADPTGWLANEPGTPRHFLDFSSAFTDYGFPVTDLADGGAILTHDAVLTAALAVQLAAQARPPDQGLPSAADVLNEEAAMNSHHTVPGAGGDLSFTDSGEPLGKPLPVVTIPPSADPSSQPAGIYVTKE